MSRPGVRQSLAGSRSAQYLYRGAHAAAVRARLTADRWWLAAVPGGRLSEDPPGRRGRILAYHSVGTRQLGINDVTPRTFERHLQVAIDDGWRFATPAAVLAEPDRPQLALTFDDGATSLLTHVLPVLRHHGIPATAFIVTGWADGRHPRGHDFILDWAGVADLAAGGMSLASHSVSHPDFSRLDPARVRQELADSRSRMSTVLGIDPDEFAIPFGQSRNWTRAAAAAATQTGYTKVYAQCVQTRPEGTIPRTFITRIDRPVVFRAALRGVFDRWEERY